MNQIETIFKYIAVILMAVIIVTVSLQILSREVIYFPTSWTQEVAKFSFIWMTLIGAALGIRNGSHVSIDILVSNLTSKLRTIISYAIELGIISFMVVLLYQSIKFIAGSQGQTSPTLGVPVTYIYSGLIVFSILSLIFSIERIINVRKNINNDLMNEQNDYLN